jgi:hypothetical protein
MSLITNCFGVRVTTTCAGQSIYALSTSAMSGLIVIGSIACAEPQSSVRLTTEEIRQIFSGVRDDAMVQDAAGTSAVNYWCADGTFTNEWSNETGSGQVVGRWRAINDQRCVVIFSGLPDDSDTERCSPILRDGGQYLSVNPDGSIHGVHTLSPITTEEIHANCQKSEKDLKAPWSLIPTAEDQHDLVEAPPFNHEKVFLFGHFQDQPICPRATYLVSVKFTNLLEEGALALS